MPFEGITDCAETVVTKEASKANVAHVRYIAIVSYACSREGSCARFVTEQSKIMSF